MRGWTFVSCPVFRGAGRVAEEPLDIVRPVSRMRWRGRNGTSRRDIGTHNSPEIGVVAATVISGLVVFFPALLTMTFGLRSASRQSADVCRAYGGGTWTVARKVMLPSAMPALFASARIAVPGAVIGAMLAEWLATGQGMGYGMLQDANSFNYVDIWASVALLTGVSVLLYNVIAILESAVLARFSLRDANA